MIHNQELNFFVERYKELMAETRCLIEKHKTQEARIPFRIAVRYLKRLRANGVSSEYIKNYQKKTISSL